MELPKTLLEAVRYFADLDTCHAYMTKVKWPGGIGHEYTAGRAAFMIRGAK